ncbi:MAG: phosphotransferase [Thermoanaerobaculia bacterium]|nr:phosphotransferase [Thermoanaerobaculia bacterium]
MVFLLPEAGPDPAAVLQLCPAADVTAFGDEAGAVRWLGSSLSSPLAEKVPRVLLHEVRGELEVLALSALPGTSAYVELRRRGPSGSLATRHLDAAVDWLVPFQRETRSERRWRLPSWSELAPPGTDPATEPDWFRLLRDGLDRRPLPRVGRHGDSWPRNLLLGAEGGVSGVVDWEAFRTNASPLDDLFDFALAYGESVSGGGSPGSLDSFLGTFGEGSFPGPRVWTYVRQTLAGLGVEPGLDRPLLGVYLLERARRVGVGPRSRLARDRPASFWLECFRRWSP